MVECGKIFVLNLAHSVGSNLDEVMAYKDFQVMCIFSIPRAAQVVTS